jgi:hypothetical protein
MSRCLTLEEYLEQFVDENTQSAEEEVKLLVTDQQAQTLGFFFIDGLAGFVESVRLQRGPLHTSASENEGEPQNEVTDDSDMDEFIN